MDWIYKNLNEEERKKIVVFGQSLGGAVAIHLASENPEKVKVLIVENSFLSIPKLLSDMSMFLTPLTGVLNQVFDSASAIQKVKAHLMLLSGEKDELVPPSHMKKLFELATLAKSKKFVSFPYGDHNRLSDEVNYYDEINNYIMENT